MSALEEAVIYLLKNIEEGRGWANPTARNLRYSLEFQIECRSEQDDNSDLNK